MPKQPNWPSRDTYVVLEALTFAIEAFERLPIEFRPKRSISDLKRLVDGLVRHDVTLAQAQSLALRRLEVIANGNAVPRSR
jgi:hypothetical protein